MCMCGKMLWFFFHPDVSVSVPGARGFDEEEGMVQVCVSLFVMDITQRDVTITVSTRDGTGNQLSVLGLKVVQKPNQFCGVEGGWVGIAT